MKHNFKITLILIAMFLITQLIGIYVIGTYLDKNNQLPFGMEPPEEVKQQTQGFPWHILLSFVFAISIFFILKEINAESFIRAWFFFVTVLALGLAFNALLLNAFYIPKELISGLALLIAIPLTYYKIYKRDIRIHNLTELLIYPGIAAVFVPILSIFGVIIVLLFISIYDIWAVWHSGFMQKLASYQMNNVKTFAGFFIPYANNQVKLKIKKIKDRYEKKGDKVLEEQLKKAKLRINLAILGGGDVVFPIITAGVFYKTMGLLPALVITAFSVLAILFLFVFAKKDKYYPAMPFLSAGMYLGMIVNWLIF